jgi:hypothetical protein
MIFGTNFVMTGKVFIDGGVGGVASKLNLIPELENQINFRFYRLTDAILTCLQTVRP